jgi:hypothetical protein
MIGPDWSGSNAQPPTVIFWLLVVVWSSWPRGLPARGSVSTRLLSMLIEAPPQVSTWPPRYWCTRLYGAHWLSAT